MVSALASRIRDREFESRHEHFPQNQIIILFISLSFLFISLNFEVKQCAKYIESTTILDLQWKRRKTFLFFKMANTPHKGKTRSRRIAWLSSFLFKVQCFNRDENDLAPDDKYYIRGKRKALWFWQHFARTITLAVFDISIVSTESQVLYSFIIKVRMGTPFFFIFLSSFNSIVH